MRLPTVTIVECAEIDENTHMVTITTPFTPIIYLVGRLGGRDPPPPRPYGRDPIDHMVVTLGVSRVLLGEKKSFSTCGEVQHR